MMPNNNSPRTTHPLIEDEDDIEPTSLIVVTTTTRSNNNARLLHKSDNNHNSVVVEMNTNSSSASSDDGPTKHHHKKHQRRSTAMPSGAEPAQLDSPKHSVPNAGQNSRSVTYEQQNNNTAPKRRTKLKQPKHYNTEANNNDNTAANQKLTFDPQKNSSGNKFHQHHERLVPVSGSSATSTVMTTTQRTHMGGPTGLVPPHLHQQQQQRQSLWERTKKVPIVNNADEAESRNTAAVAAKNKTYYEYEHIEVQKRKRSPKQLKSELEARKRNFEWRRRIKTPSSSSSRHHQHCDSKKGARHHSLDHLSIPLSSTSSSTSSNSSSENDDDTRNTAKAAAKFLAERQRARSRSPAAQARRRRQRAASTSQNLTNPGSTTTAFGSHNNNTSRSNSVTPRSASLLSVRDMPSAALSSLFITNNEKQSLDDIFNDLVATVDKQQPTQRVGLPTFVTVSPQQRSSQQQNHLTAASAERLRAVDNELERQLEELQHLQQQQPATAAALPVPAIVVSRPAAASETNDSKLQQPTKFPVKNTTPINSAVSPIPPSSTAVTTKSSSIVKRFIPIPPAKSGALMTIPPPPSPAADSLQKSEPSTEIGIPIPTTATSFNAFPTPWRSTNNTMPVQQQQHADDWKAQNAIPTPSSSSNAGSIIVSTTHVNPPTSIQQPRPTSSRLMSMSITGPTPVFTLQPNLQWNTPEQQEVNLRRKSLNSTEAENNEDSSATGQSVNFMRRFFERFTPSKLQGESHSMTTTTTEPRKPEIRPRHPSPVTTHLNKILLLDGESPTPSAVANENSTLQPTQQTSSVPFSTSPPPLPSLSPATTPSSCAHSPPSHVIEPLKVKQINNAQFRRIPAVLSPSSSKRSSVTTGPSLPRQPPPQNVVDESPMLPDFPPSIAMDFTSKPFTMEHKRPTSLNLTSSRSSASASPTPAASIIVGPLARPDSVDSLQRKFDELDDLCHSIASQQSHQLQPHFSSSTKISPLPPKINSIVHHPHASLAPPPPTRNIAQIVRALNKQSTVPLNAPAPTVPRRSQSTRVSARAVGPVQTPAPQTVMTSQWSSAAKVRPVSAELSPPTQNSSTTNRLSTFQAPITAFSMPQPPVTTTTEQINNFCIPFADSSPASQTIQATPSLVQQQELPHLHYATNPALHHQQQQQHSVADASPTNFSSNPSFATQNIFRESSPPQNHNFFTNYQFVPMAEPMLTTKLNADDVLHKAWPINADTFSSSSPVENVKNFGTTFHGAQQQDAPTSRSSIPTPVITVNKDTVYATRRVRRPQQTSPATAGSTMRVTFPAAEPHVEFDDSFTRWLVQSQTKPSSSTVQRVISDAVKSENPSEIPNHVLDDGQRQYPAIRTAVVNNNYDSYAQPSTRSRRAGSQIPAPSSYGPTTSRISNRPSANIGEPNQNLVVTRRVRPTVLYAPAVQHNTEAIHVPNYMPSRRNTVLEAEVSLLSPSTIHAASNNGWSGKSASTFNPTRTTSLVTLSPTTPTSLSINYHQYHTPTAAYSKHQSYPVYTTTQSFLSTSDTGHTGGVCE